MTQQINICRKIISDGGITVSFIYGSYVVAYVNPNDFNRIKAADLSRLSFLRPI